MIAFDTDILSDMIGGHAGYLARAAATPLPLQFAPVVAAGEVLRGWLAAIRTAEAGRGRIGLDLAYRQLDRSLKGLAGYPSLPYDAAAHARFLGWRTTIRIGANDLRIAASAVEHGVTLVTRNARDYAQVPGLKLEIWP